MDNYELYCAARKYRIGLEHSDPEGRKVVIVRVPGEDTSCIVFNRKPFILAIRDNHYPTGTLVIYKRRPYYLHANPDYSRYLVGQNDVEKIVLSSTSPTMKTMKYTEIKPKAARKSIMAMCDESEYDIEGVIKKGKPI